MFREV